MLVKRSLFHSRQSRQSFWILLIGSLLIVSASISIFGTYLLYGHRGVTKERVAITVIRAMVLVNSIPAEDLPKALRVIDSPGVWVSVDAASLPQAQIVPLSDPQSIREYIFKHTSVFRISIPLPNEQWLNIRAYRAEHVWLMVGLVISSLVLLFALIALCVWTIKRLDLPLPAFSKAAQRFGVDIQSPPLAPMGPPEMQEVIQAFNKMQNRIRRLLHDRTQMLAAISHDLRTPITRLQLRAEYLKGTTQYEKAVADLREMENMIASILSFARDYVRSESMERFDLNALLESICNDMVDVGHDVTYHSDFERMPYFGRISALKRAFTNLIDNAIKYGNKAEVFLKKSGNDIHIKISDEGPGIPEDQFEKVFAPFYRVDTARSPSQSGAGLGLAVARDIIRTHGGDISLLNREPQGLNVLVTLPSQL